MNDLPAYITAGLRFPNGDILCKGDRWQRGCKAADGEAAYAIHTFDGKHFCGFHSPFDNKYVPCVECSEKPALMAEETAPVCDDCRKVAAGHVCDEDAERAQYRQYVSDGLADTDGHFAPESFEAWRAHYHREIGHKEPRTEECTDTECKAPQHERTRCLNTGTRRKPRYESFCPSCYEPRQAAIVAAERARRAPRRLAAA
ncbi:hypothetical protein [Streptomyces sp. NPDC006334]|uniref:hypothetical protein n=1 Tax=Streptomyces sp. NPDC006334 TaxID=3156754 RepID=UPI0033A526F8